MNRDPISFWSVLLALRRRWAIGGVILQKWFLLHSILSADKKKLLSK
jgi:hypothetical protein